VPTLEEIGDAIGVQVQTLAGIRVQQEFGDVPNVSGNALVAVVEYDGTTYDSAYEGQAAEVNYKLVVLGAAGSERATRKKLLDLCDPTRGSATSIASAVTGNLGGVVTFCRVASNSGLQDLTIGSGEGAQTYPGIEFVLVVMPT
jgi:hypothetical protein